MLRILLSLAVLLACAPATALNIVLTNDDGFETENIQALYRALVKANHNVIMAAPYVGQSGTGGQIAALRPLGPTKVASEQGLLPAGSPAVGATTIAPQQYYVDSSPVVSVAYGIDVLSLRTWGSYPDLVIAGPNQGNNLGVITPHSGTLGAAVTALNKQIPAIAVSAAGKDAAAAKIVADLVIELIDALQHREGIRLSTGVGLNVNTPPIDALNTTAADFRFAYTRLGKSANVGLQFFENLGDSVLAQSAGIPPDVNLPGLAIVVPPSAAHYPEDTSATSETNALQTLVVTVSPIQGTYAADRKTSSRLKRKLHGLLDKRARSRDTKPSDKE